MFMYENEDVSDEQCPPDVERTGAGPEKPAVSISEAFLIFALFVFGTLVLTELHLTQQWPSPHRSQRHLLLPLPDTTTAVARPFGTSDVEHRSSEGIGKPSARTAAGSADVGDGVRTRRRRMDGPVWKPVSGSLRHMHAYSAFYDPRPDPPLVRVVTGKLRDLDERVWCKFYYKPRRKQAHGTRPFAEGIDRHDQYHRPTIARVVKGRVENHLEDAAKLYAVGVMTCPLPTGMNTNNAKSTRPTEEELPAEVSIHAETEPSEDVPLDAGVDGSSNNLPLLNTDVAQSDGAHKNLTAGSLGVCVRPVFNNYNDTSALIQFIEMFQILGASGFTFYNMSLSPETECILKLYRTNGVLEILQWNLPWPKQIHEEGQLAAANDCLYRNMWKYEYLAFVDLDEIPLPHRHEDLLQLIDLMFSDTRQRKSSRRRGGLATGSIMFRNVYFYKQWPDDEESGRGSYGLPIIRKTRRIIEISSVFGAQTKYIVRARAVVNTGVHYVQDFVHNGYESSIVPVFQGLLHHYRTADDVELLGEPSVVDKSAWRFLPQLLKKLNGTAARELENTCGIKL